MAGVSHCGRAVTLTACSWTTSLWLSHRSGHGAFTHASPLLSGSRRIRLCDIKATHVLPSNLHDCGWDTSGSPHIGACQSSISSGREHGLNISGSYLTKNTGYLRKQCPIPWTDSLMKRRQSCLLHKTSTMLRTHITKFICPGDLAPGISAPLPHHVRYHNIGIYVIYQKAIFLGLPIWRSI